ncbi:DUF3164 family protein [Xanthobacter autotrophicus]|uniref:DUF3164 family protein n=1 Tax=Xanthobacter autotrophicus TaxID=280 RepID=UPI0037265702
METQIEYIATPQAGVEVVGGQNYMRNTSGHLVPMETIKPETLLEDQTVRKIIGYAEDLSAQITRFRGHTFDDVATFVELLAEKYGGRRGGAKGNTTITSFDGCLKVVVAVQDQLSFGPELQVAKELVDECIAAWSDGADPELRALVVHAFQVDKEGQINRAALFQLRRLEIKREPWPQAMAALGDAIRVIGSREYVRFLQAQWPSWPVGSHHHRSGCGLRRG